MLGLAVEHIRRTHICDQRTHDGSKYSASIRHVGKSCKTTIINNTNTLNVSVKLVSFVSIIIKHSAIIIILVSSTNAVSVGHLTVQM